MSDRIERPWWRMNPLVWIGLLLLAGLSIASCFGLVTFGPRTLAYAVRLLDPRGWPLWFLYPLWGAVCWRILDLLSAPDRQLAHRLKPVLVLCAILLIVWHNGWHTRWFRRRVYDLFYAPYIIGPISQFMIDGSWTWRLCIVPVAGVVVLGGLIVLMIRLRKKK